MDRLERGQIEYEVPSTDGDPLAEFGDEPEGIDAESSSTYPPVSAHPVNRNASTAFPPETSAPRSSIWSKWAAAGIISSGFAALAAGALYVNYPSWSASTAAETRGAGSEQLTARPAAGGQKPPAEHPDNTPSITHRKTEHPTATNGQATPSGTARDASQLSEAARKSSAPDVRRKQGPTAEATDSDFGPLTGQWSMNTRVESSVLRRYEGLRLEYQVRLQQVGNQVTGDGYKSRENDRAVRTRTPITLIGDVVGDRVVLNFEERGVSRKSAGRLVLDRESEDVLRGRFSSDAAKSTGVADARR